ncbi:MAG: fumarylacetoacetate hydrolase family protein [Methanomassiliicoccales archaeon]
MRPINCQKIICLACNYPDHAKEMNTEEPSEPVFFLKAPSALISDGEPIIIPDGIGRVDYEAELAIIIGKSGREIPIREARNHIHAIAAFNDVTARDLQAKAKQKGLPWTLCKGFDTFAPMSKPVPIAEAGDIDDMEIVLKLNGEVKQHGSTSMMIHKIDAVISYISKFMTLERGDIIATGTPSGIGPMKPGDFVEIQIGDHLYLKNPVISSQSQNRLVRA